MPHEEDANVTARRPARPAHRAAIGAALLFVLAACAGGGGGAPARLGPDLAAFAPDNTVVCADGYPIQVNPSFPQPFFLQGAPSCLVLTFFSGAAIIATILVLLVIV